MSDDTDVLALVDSVRALATFPEDAAVLAGPLVLKVATTFAKAGQDPYGKPWLQKKDGGRALVNAVKALSVSHAGTVIKLTLRGVEVIHNYGTKLGTKRAEQRRSNPLAFAKALQAQREAAVIRDEKKSKKSAKKGVATPVRDAPKYQTAKQTLGRYNTPPRQILPNPNDPIPPMFAKALQFAADTAFKQLGEGK